MRSDFADWLGDTNDVIKVFLDAAQIPDLVNLAGGLPDPGTWPVADLSDMAARAVAEHPTQALAYTPIGGLAGFRDYLARRFSSDAVRLTRDNVMVTSGGTQALSLIGQVLLNEGAAVACQSPTYLGALDAFRPRRPAYRPMALDRNDVDVEGAMAGAQFAYTVPNFSNPTGRMVGREMRARLLAAARDTGAWLVEDDPYGSLHFEAEELPSLLEMAGDGTPYDGPVIYTGTVAKEVAPGLRVGWVVAAPEVIERLMAAKQGSDMFTSGLTQLVSWQAMESGVADAAMAPARELYVRRRDALDAALSADLSQHFDWEVPGGGMFVWITAKDPALDTDRLMRVALDHKVCISPSSVFDPMGQDRRSARLNFTFNDETRLAEGVRRLRAAVEAV